MAQGLSEAAETQPGEDSLMTTSLLLMPLAWPGLAVQWVRQAELFLIPSPVITYQVSLHALIPLHLKHPIAQEKTFQSSHQNVPLCAKMQELGGKEKTL